MFDPFEEYEERGYLQNVKGYKTASAVKRLEDNEYKKRLPSTQANLKAVRAIGYKTLLATHQKLFGSVYPTWAGMDRLATTPTTNVIKGRVRFAPPSDIQRAAQFGLDLAQDPVKMAAQPGTVMGYLAFAHPFLEGNGRTFLAVHSEVARRASISIDWQNMDREGYLAALTKEITLPGDSHLDTFLKAFVHPNPAQELVVDH